MTGLRKNRFKWTLSRERVPEKRIGEVSGFNYEQLLYLKFFRSTVLKLQCFKPMFDRSKNALARVPGPRLNSYTVQASVFRVSTLKKI
jgi:hypothetical protein